MSSLELLPSGVTNGLLEVFADFEYFGESYVTIQSCVSADCRCGALRPSGGILQIVHSEKGWLFLRSDPGRRLRERATRELEWDGILPGRKLRQSVPTCCDSISTLTDASIDSAHN